MPESRLEINLEGNFSTALEKLYAVLNRIDDRLEKTAKGFNEMEKSIKAVSTTPLVDGLEKVDKQLASLEKNADKSLEGVAQSAKTASQRFRSFLQDGFKNLEGVAKGAADLVGKGFESGLKALNFAAMGVKLGKQFVDGVSSEFAKLGANIQSIGRDFIGRGVQTLAAGGLAAFIGSQAVGVAADFEQILRQVQVFGDLTTTELGNVRDEILAFSAETIFDPQQSIAAFLDLQKAGLDTADALTALTRVGELAAAGDQTLQEATEGVVLAVQSFGLAYADATEVTNAYVQAANAGTASVAELEQGVANVGISAKNFGLSFEETVAVLSIFNDAGIRGAEAGTQLKTILTRLSSDNKEVTQTFADLNIKLTDSQGNIRSLDSILNDLRHRMFDVRTVTVQVSKGLGEDQKNALDLASKAYESATRKINLFELGLSSASEKSIQNAREIQANASNVISSVTGSNEVLRTFQTEVQNSQIENVRILQQLGGTFGQLGLATLVAEDENAIADFVAQMGELPTAATIATNLMDTFKGSLDSLKGSLETLLIKALLPVMDKGFKPLIQFLINVVNSMTELPEPLLAGIAALGAMTAAIITLTGVGLILLGLVLQPLGTAFIALSTVLSAVTALLFNPIGMIAGFAALSAAAIILIPLIIGLGAGLVALVSIFNDIKNNVDGSRDSLENLINSISTLATEAIGLGTDIFNFFAGIDSAGSTAQSNLQPIIGLFETIREKVDSLVSGIQDLRNFLQLIGAIRAEPQFDTTAAQGQLDALIQKRDQLTQAIVGGTGGAAQTVTVEPGQSFASIAGGAGLTIEELIALNPQLGGVRPRVQPGDVFTVGMDVDATPALAELETVNTEIEKIRTQLEVSGDDTAFLEKRAELEAQIAENKARSRNLPEEDRAALQEGTDALQIQLDALNEMGQAKVIDLFTEFEGTPLFDRLFGTEANLDTVRQAVAEIDANFATIKDNISLVADGFIKLTGGDVTSGITDIAIGSITIADKVEDIFEQVTGIDLGTGIEEKLAPFINFFNSIKEFGQAQFIGNIIDDIVALPSDIRENVTERDIENLEKLGNFLLAVGGIAFNVGSRLAILSSGLIPLHAAIASFDEILDILLGLVDLFVSIAELDGEGIKESLKRIGEGIVDLFEEITTTGAQDIADVLGLNIDVDTVGETLDQLFVIMKAIFLKIERAVLELDLKVGEAINSILRSLQSILDLGDSALEALGLGDLASVEIGEIDLTPRAVNLDVNTIKQQLLGGATAEHIIELGVTGEVSFEAIEVAAEGNEELQKALDTHFATEDFNVTIGQASMVLQQDAIDPETAAELASQLSDQLQTLADAGELTPEIALTGLNVKEQLQIATGEAPSLTTQEIDWVNQLGLDTLATPGGALDTALKAAGDQIVEDFNVTIGQASMVLQQDAIDPETAAELASQLSDQLQTLADAGELTPEIALTGLNVKEQLQIATGEAPSLTTQEIDWVNQLGLDTLATPGGALDTALKAAGDQIVTGLDTGIQESEVDPAQNMADVFQETFNGAFLIESPSGWMFDRGLDLMQGLADGMADGMALVQAQVDAIIAQLMRIDQAIQELVRRAQQAFFALGVGMINASILFQIGAERMALSVLILSGHFRDLLWTLQNINAQLGAIVVNSLAINAGGGGTSGGATGGSFTGFQAGGLSEPGFFLAGEAGRELIASDTRLAVLNNRTTESFLAGFNLGATQSPSPIANAGGGGFSFADNRTIYVDARGSNLSEQQVTTAVINALRESDRETLPFQKRATIAGLL